uniref:Uncharacterized protein n=2 Tax=Magallana gigas TaxID=29159 RepID=A0A8W8ITR1_MAGGI
MLLSSVLGVTEITFIFILLSSFTLKVDGNKAYGNCTDSEKKTRCCVNYYYTNGTCTQCPKGTFGENCSTQCPDNMYGESCAKRCDCKANQVCNRVDGCIDSWGTCGNNGYELICCINYILKDGYCKECPHGTYSQNCSEDCPPGKYGLLCKGICNCDAKKCDKAVGCSKKESDFQTTGEIYWIIWIIPALIGIVIFIIICIYRRSQPRKRQFVDIPMYQHEINGNTSDNYDHMADITMAKNGETIDSRKLRATSPATITIEVGTSDEIQDTGEYHTLNLRVFDYEEPIKHEQLKRSRSENSSLYFDCPARQIISVCRYWLVKDL